MIHQDYFLTNDYDIINRIIYDLYNNTGDIKNIYTNFLCSLRNIIHFDKANFYFFSNKEGLYEIDLFLPYDWKEAYLKKYLDFYYQIDDTLPIISCSSPVMFKCYDVFVENMRKKTQFYKELIKPAGIHYSIEGNVYSEEKAKDSYYGGFGIYRSIEKRDFSQGDLQVLKLLQPHLFSVTCNYNSSGNNVSLASFINLLNDLDYIGISILDDKYNLVFCNNKFDKFNDQGEIIKNIHVLCSMLAKNLDNNLNKHIESRLEFNNGSCFIEVSKVVMNSSSNNYKFVAIIYDIPNMLLKSLLQLKDQYKLTEREFEVIQLVLDGLKNEEIAVKLCVSLPTVKKHLSAAYEKLGLKSRNQIIDILK